MRWVVWVCGAVFLAACAPPSAVQPQLALRNPTVPIGAILRFEAAKFDGNWRVNETAGGVWTLLAFSVSDTGTAWREVSQAQGPGAQARITPRATGILRLDYGNGAFRDLWVIWTDPDHNTVALGDPDGRFGFVATRLGAYRTDQVTAARQVLDFNGYRTDNWEKVSE